MKIKRISASLAALLLCFSLSGTVLSEQSASNITVCPSRVR